ncbi:MAG: HAMP domain-containing histidine kinase, partial [Bacteroidia bacterium]|nr:HAMP domain-containing histidine kinase [Bacteroidia bacterium]
EERRIRKEITAVLEPEIGPDAMNIAEKLAMMGFSKDYERFYPLFHHPKRNEIIQFVLNLVQVERNSENIKTASERAGKIMFAMKSYSRQSADDTMISSNLIQNIDSVLVLYHHQLKKGIEVVRKYSTIPEVYCYPDKLSQVWTNIIHNAMQAMDYQGVLTIEINQLSDSVQVRITDTGKGIPPEIKDKIFEPFFTTKKAGEGSGLGLDIVRKIILQHSGKIEVESEPGKTTFIVTLPINPKTVKSA